jgi:hypothetical protein
MRTKLGSLTLALLLVGELTHAELYHVTVSREAQDLYRVDYAPRDVYLKTRYCYVYCYFEEALIDTDRMEIHFLDSDDECDIDKILSE